MALISCPECGKMISDKAKFCPSCGYPIDTQPVTQLDFCKVPQEVEEEFSADDLYLLGISYYFGENGIDMNQDQGIAYLKSAAKKGSIDAQVQLGDIYLNTNVDEAIVWFTHAAETGNPQAQLYLASTYIADKHDYRAATKWLQKAADQNLPEAQYLLANNYFFGQGIQQDYKQAFKWNMKAATQANIKHPRG